jgi:copper(I)-binding protein
MTIILAPPLAGRFIALALSLVFLQKDPTASDAWAQVSGDTATVYATVTNPTMYDVYLVSGKTDAAAAKVELLNGDKVVTSLPIPAYESLELKPEGPRVRVSGLQGQPKAGDELKLTLETDGGVAIALAAIIK